MASDRRKQTLRLKDGRRLGYAEYGDPRGRPLFYFHGFPNSRIGARMAGEIAAGHGTRLIAFDRPGFGLSDLQPERTILDWPDDVVEAADALGIGRFAVIGVSGGGPYAAACAARIPERLTSVAIVSGVAPIDAWAASKGMRLRDRLSLALARRLPWYLHVILWLIGFAARRFPNLLLRIGGRSLPKADKEIMARPEVRKDIAADLAEAFRQGTRGAVWELGLYMRPWGFPLEEIAMEVHLWQGEADTIVLPSMGRYLAETIPKAHARFFPGEGHLLIVDRMEEVHAALFPEASPAERAGRGSAP